MPDAAQVSAWPSTMVKDQPEQYITQRYTGTHNICHVTVSLAINDGDRST